MSSPPAGAPAGAAPRSRSRGRVLAWTLGILLAVVGVIGFVAANVNDTQNQDSYAADYAVLGQHDPGTETQALNARVQKVNAAYDAYLAVTATVHVRHEAVTDQFNAVVSPLDPANLIGIQRERAKLPGVIAAYDAAVKRERVALRVYLDQLALLKARAAR